MLSFSDPNRHFIIKPGQLLGPVKLFQEVPQLKQIYVLIIGLKDVLGVGLPSFLLKKVICSDQSKSLGKHTGPNDSIEPLLYKILCTNELKPKFTEHVDYKMYNSNTNWGGIYSIYLTARGQQRLVEI